MICCCHDKISQCRWLQQKSVSHRFGDWKSEPSALRFSFWGCNSYRFIDDYLLAMCPQGLSSVCTQRESKSSGLAFLEGCYSHWIKGSPLWPHLTESTPSAKSWTWLSDRTITATTVSVNTVTLQIRAFAFKLWGNKIQSISLL